MTCVGAVVSLALLSGCAGEKSTSPTDRTVYLMINYFPLNEGDEWRWELPADTTFEPFVDGDINLGEPFVDLNKNGTHDHGEEYQDLSSNGKYDGPNDPWTPGVPFIDRNNDGDYDPPNGVWDEGEFFVDLDGDGIWDVMTTQALCACVLHTDERVKTVETRCRGRFGGGRWARTDVFSNDSLGFRWHRHVDTTDATDLLGELGPITIARPNVHVGDSVVNSYSSYAAACGSSPCIWISVFEGLEEVTVPAGIFRDCLKFRSVALGWTGNMEECNGISYQWYAGKVGLVKSEGPGKSQYCVLTSATIGGTSYP
jgi:hypothetical protein